MNDTTTNTLGLLSEPSTWASLAALLSFFAPAVPALADPAVMHGITGAGVAIAGLLGVFMREKKPA